jgi:hypothetical protein
MLVTTILALLMLSAPTATVGQIDASGTFEVTAVCCFDTWCSCLRLHYLTVSPFVTGFLS